MDLRVGVISSYPPRQCGIATFSHSLLGAMPSGDTGDLGFRVAAVSPLGFTFPYNPPVSLEISQEELSDYRRAAEHLNAAADVVLLQHEFGLFGGPDGEFIVDLASRLEQPLVVTFHTVLARPNPNQRRVMIELGRLASRAVVMTGGTRTLLRTAYGVREEKTHLIPHGVPDVPATAMAVRPQVPEIEGRRLVLTIGLLSPGKGIELALEALAEVVGRYPDLLYLIIGATHPEVRRRHGEAYRQFLQSEVQRLQLSDHVRFLDCFLPEGELMQYLRRADVYITPYPSREQSSSGTLTYAMAGGAAIVSTPYPYAKELLGEDAGLIVDFDSPQSLSRAVLRLLGDDALRAALGQAAYARTRSMVWPVVGRHYASLLAGCAAGVDRSGRMRGRSRVWTPEPSLEHLDRLSDPVGILQHAIGAVPDRRFGYCTDDVARTLLFALDEIKTGRRDRVQPLLDASLAFLQHAYNEETGRFRNFLGYDRHWVEEGGSDDANGRAIMAIGHLTAANLDGGYQAAGLKLLHVALEHDVTGKSLRALAYAVLGLHAHLTVHPGDNVIFAHQAHLARLLKALTKSLASDWPWPEEMVTYENGRIPQALLAAGRFLGDDELIESGLRLTQWLFASQTAPDGHLSLIGNRGWWRLGTQPAHYDQQPVEIPALIGAARAAYEVTGDAGWLDRAENAYAWYFGANDKGISLYEPATGGCYDGLTPLGVNTNQGAESVLSLLLSWQAVRAIRSLGVQRRLPHLVEMPELQERQRLPAVGSQQSGTAAPR